MRRVLLERPANNKYILLEDVTEDMDIQVECEESNEQALILLSDKNNTVYVWVRPNSVWVRVNVFHSFANALKDRLDVQKITRSTVTANGMIVVESEKEIPQEDDESFILLKDIDFARHKIDIVCPTSHVSSSTVIHSLISSEFRLMSLSSNIYGPRICSTSEEMKEELRRYLQKTISGEPLYEIYATDIS